MAGGDKKVGTGPAKDNEAPPKSKGSSDVDRPKAEGGETAADSPSGYSRGEGQKPVSKAYKDNWNAIYAKEKRRSDSWINGTGMAVGYRAAGYSCQGVCSRRGLQGRSCSRRCIESGKE